MRYFDARLGFRVVEQFEFMVSWKQELLMAAFGEPADFSGVEPDDNLEGPFF